MQALLGHALQSRLADKFNLLEQNFVLVLGGQTAIASPGSRLGSWWHKHPHSFRSSPSALPAGLRAGQHWWRSQKFPPLGFSIPKGHWQRTV